MTSFMDKLPEVNIAAVKKMMSASHLQSTPHTGLNGSQDLRVKRNNASNTGNGNNAIGCNMLNDEQKANNKRFFQPRAKRVAVETLPLEDAARRALATLPLKTPVSILQELLSRRGTAPNYELMQIEGAIHEPTFRYRVAVGEYAAQGSGRSKKEAKHAAAKNVLDTIVGNPVPDEVPLPESGDAAKNLITSPYDDKIPGNPIGTLQELCMSRHWPPPTYDLKAEEGQPHERQFTITCIVLKYHEVGSGKSKKLAKRQAAHKMWEKLQDVTSANTEEMATETAETLSERYSQLKNSKIPSLTPPVTHKVASFHKNLKQSSGIKLGKLQTEVMTKPDFNFVQFLQEIASEQHFEVTYVDVEETSNSGKHQCLVQLSTLPVAVCYGCGASGKEARTDAAQNALEYLKIMTKK